MDDPWAERPKEPTPEPTTLVEACYLLHDSDERVWKRADGSTYAAVGETVGHDAATEFLEAADCDAGKWGRSGRTPLMLAVDSNSKVLFDKLLEREDVKKTIDHQETRFGQTALHMAVERHMKGGGHEGNAHFVKALVAANASKTLKSAGGRNLTPEELYVKGLPELSVPAVVPEQAASFLK